MTPGDWRYQPAPGQTPWRPVPTAQPPGAPLPAAPKPATPLVGTSSSALVFRHVKIAPHEIPRVLAEMDAVVGRQRTKLLLRFILVLAIAGALFVIPPLGLFAVLVTLIYFHGKRKHHRRMVAKVEFLRSLLELLVDELHPRAPVRFDFDLSAYNESDKLFRSASSAAGNKKSYYSDKWLRLRVCLADKTQVEVVRQQGIKVKKGNVQFEKRRLFVTVTPNPRRYRPMSPPLANRLRWQLSEEILKNFHNRPEQIHVHVAPENADIGLRIVQEDVEILPREVLVVLYGTLSQLRDQHMAASVGHRPSR